MIFKQPNDNDIVHVLVSITKSGKPIGGVSAQDKQSFAIYNLMYDDVGIPGAIPSTVQLAPTLLFYQWFTYDGQPILDASYIAEFIPVYLN